MSRLRPAGVEDLSQVRLARMEGDGGIRVIRADDAPRRRRRRPPG